MPPIRLLRLLPRDLAAQFLKFGMVGLIGFMVDTAAVYALRRSIGIYSAGMSAYVLAATVTWALNRSWTFRGQGRGPAHRQWLRFLLANLVGFALNRGMFVALVASLPFAADQPVVAVLAGAGVGMLANFGLSRKMVFRAGPT